MSDNDYISEMCQENIRTEEIKQRKRKDKGEPIQLSIKKEDVGDVLENRDNLKYYNYEFFWYRNGHYMKANVEMELKPKIQSIFDLKAEDLKGKGYIIKNTVDDKFCEETLKYVQRTAIIKDKDINPWLITTRNAAVDVKNRTVIPLNPSIFVPYFIDVLYNENAHGTKIDKFIEQVVGIEYKDTVYEVIGDCFFPDYPHKKITYFHSQHPNSGKTTLINMFSHFLGNKNVSSISPLDFDYKFAFTDILNVLAIISDELAGGFLNKTVIGYLKKLSGGAAFNIYVKHVKNIVKYLSRGKMILTSNSFISLTREQIKEETAFIGRWNIITCPKTFSRNPNFLSNIETEEEFSSLLNNVLKGINRLSKNQKFSTETTYEENLSYFRKYQVKEKKAKVITTYEKEEEIDENELGDEVHE